MLWAVVNLRAVVNIEDVERGYSRLVVVEYFEDLRPSSPAPACVT
jgi:hypothetical protein